MERRVECQCVYICKALRRNQQTGRSIVHTTRTTFKLVAVLVCIAAFLWLAACDETTIEDLECRIKNEREIQRLMSTPEGLEFPIEEYSRDYLRYRAEMSLIEPVFEKLSEKYRKQPNAHGMGITYILDENGQHTGELGIVIEVTEKVPQYRLHPEDRIPSRIECVAIQIVEEPDTLKPW